MMGVARVRAGLRGVAKKWIGPFVADRQPRRVDIPPATWGLAVGPNGSLWSGPVDLAALAGSHGSPVHVVLADMLDRNARDALSGAAEHRFDVFYSFKTNPVPAVIRRLYDLGIGAEVISPFELWMARRLGVAPERIVYNGPAKSDESLIEAISTGVHLVNANSASEARRIGDLADELRRPVNLGLRVALPGSWAGQFGLAASSATLVDTVRDAANRRFVNLRALHAHRGKTILTPGDVTAHVSELLTVCDNLRKEAGWHPEILDIGGSLACPTSRPIPTRQFRLNRGFGSDLLPPNPATAISISDAAALARRLVDDHFAPHGARVATTDHRAGSGADGEHSAAPRLRRRRQDRRATRSRDPRRRDQRRRTCPERVSPALPRATSERGARAELSARRPDLYTGRRPLQQLVASGAALRRRPRGDGLRRLLRAVLDRVLLRPCRDRDAGRRDHRGLSPSGVLRGHRSRSTTRSTFPIDTA